MISTTKFSVILWSLAQMLRYKARRHPAFAARLKERNLVAEIIARDEEIGRWYALENGRLTTGRGRHAKPDVVIAFKNARLGADLLMPPINWLNQINAQKDFKLTVEGSEDLTNWFAQTIMLSQSVGWKIGTEMPDGSKRYCNMANGGPLFVYVKDGRIIRTTPIDFADDDPPEWTIEARGLKFTPPRKTTLAPHGQYSKSTIYSPDRLLYPMKRVDFDPNGERNVAQSRQVGVCADFLGRGAFDRRRRDQAGAARAWSRCHGGVARLASYLGQYRLLSQCALSLPQCRRPHGRASQSRFMGGMVLGRGASLGLYAACRPVRDLRHRRGLSARTVK